MHGLQRGPFAQFQTPWAPPGYHHSPFSLPLARGISLISSEGNPIVAYLDLLLYQWHFINPWSWPWFPQSTNGTSHPLRFFWTSQHCPSSCFFQAFSYLLHRSPPTAGKSISPSPLIKRAEPLELCNITDYDRLEPSLLSPIWWIVFESKSEMWAWSTSFDLKQSEGWNV